MQMTAKLSWQDNDLPFSEVFGDTYYSHADGRAECGHVFLGGNGLPERWQDSGHFQIGELGFGTGLNFLHTWSIWCVHRKPGQQLSFMSVEAFPMTAAQVERALSRWDELTTLTRQLVERWSNLQTGPIRLDEQTELHVVFAEAQEAIAVFPGNIDAWYLDGFSPAKNPQMWSPNLMKALAEHTKPGGTIASYTAAGWVRRNLTEAGFDVEKRQGFGTKRDMIVGIKPLAAP